MPKDTPFENMEFFDMLDSSGGDLTKMTEKDQANLIRRLLEFNKEIADQTAKFDGASKKSIQQLDKLTSSLQSISKTDGAKAITSYISNIKQNLSKVVSATEKINSGVERTIKNASKTIEQTASALGSSSNKSVSKPVSDSGLKDAVKTQKDLYNRAVKVIRNKQSATINLLKNELGMTNQQAKTIMNQLEQNGLVGTYNTGKTRKVNVAPASRVSADRIKAIKDDLAPLDTKQRALYRDISKIQNPTKRQIAFDSLKYFPKNFWTNPTSPSGEHHPEWQRGLGGNVAHTRDMMQMVDQARNNPNSEMYKSIRQIQAQRGGKLNQDTFDNAILSSLLHDADKFVAGDVNERGFERTDMTHEKNPFGRMLPKSFQDSMVKRLGEDTFNEIKGSVESHAGKHTDGDARTAVETIRKSLTAAMVNMADGISSDLNKSNKPKGGARVAKILGNIDDNTWKHVDSLIDEGLSTGKTAVGDMTKAGRNRVFSQWQNAVSMGQEVTPVLKTKLNGIGLPSGIVDDNLRNLMLSGGNLGKIKRLSGNNSLNVIQDLIDTRDSLGKLQFKDKFAAVDPQLLQMQYLNPSVLTHASEALRRSKRPEESKQIQSLSDTLDLMVESVAQTNRVDGKEDVYKTLRDINLKAQNSRTAIKNANISAAKTGAAKAGSSEEYDSRRVNKDKVEAGYKETVEDKKKAMENLKAQASLAAARKELANLYTLEAKSAKIQQTGTTKGGPVAYAQVDRSAVSNRLNEIESLSNPRLAREELAKIRAGLRVESSKYKADMQQVMADNYKKYGSTLKPSASVSGGGSSGGRSAGSGGTGGGYYKGDNGIDFGGSAKGLLWNLKNSAWGMAGTLTGINSFVQLLREGTTAIKDQELAVINLKRVWDGTASDLNNAGQAITNTAIKYGDTLENVGVIQEEWAKTGVKNYDDLSSLTNVTELALNTSDITGAGDAVKYLNSALVQMEMPLSDANKLLDSWNKTADQFPADTKDFAEAYQRSAAYAKNLGLDMNDLNSIISILIERTGRSGEEVGTALRMMFSNVYIPKSVKTLEGLGIEMHHISEDGQHMTSKFRPFIDILTEMNQKADTFKSQVGPSLFSPKSIDILEKMGVQMHKVDASGKEMKDQFRSVGEIMSDIDAKGLDTKKLGLPTEVSANLMGMAKTLGETRRINFALAAIEGFGEFQDVRNISQQGVQEQYSLKKNEMTMESLYKISLQLKAAFGELAVSIGEAGLLNMLKDINSGATGLLTTFSGLDARVPLLNTKIRDLITVFLLYKAAQLGINKLTKEFMGMKLSTKLTEYATGMADMLKSNVLRKDIGQGAAYNNVFNKMMNNDAMKSMYANETQRQMAVIDSLDKLGLAKRSDISLTQQMVTVDNASSLVRAKNISMTQAEIIAKNEEYAITSTGLVYKRNEAGVYALSAGAKAEDVMTTEALAAAQAQASTGMVLNNAKTAESILVVEADAVAKIEDAAATETLAVANQTAAASSTMATMGMNLLIGAIVLLAYSASTASDNMEQLTNEQYENAKSAYEQVGKLSSLMSQYEALQGSIEDLNKSETKGADSTNNHTSALADQASQSRELTDQTSQLLDIQKQIADIAPELIGYYNSEGEAISDNIKTMQEYLKWKKEMLNQDLDSLSKDYQIYGKDQEDKLKDMQDRAKLMQIAQEALLNVPRSERDKAAHFGSDPYSDETYVMSLDRSLTNMTNLVQEYGNYHPEYRKFLTEYMDRTGKDLGSTSGGLLDRGLRSTWSVNEALERLSKTRKEHNKNLQEEKQLYERRKQAYESVQEMQGKESLGLNNESKAFGGMNKAILKSKSALDAVGIAMGDMETLSDSSIGTLVKNISILERAKDPLSKSYQDALRYIKANVEGANSVITESNGLLKTDSIEGIKTVAETHIQNEKDKTRETIKQNKERLDTVITTLDLEIAKLNDTRKAYEGVSINFIGPSQNGKRFTDSEAKAAESYRKEIDSKISEANKQKSAIEDAKSQLDDKLANVNEPTDLAYNSDTNNEANKYKALDNRLKIIDNTVKNLQTGLKVLDTLWQDDADNAEYLTSKLSKLKTLEDTYAISISKLRTELSKLSPSADAEKYTEIQDTISSYTQELYDNMHAQQELNKTKFQGTMQNIDRDLERVNKQLELNTQSIKDGAGAYDESKLKLDAYISSVKLTQSKLTNIQKEIDRVNSVIKNSSGSAKSAGNEFKRMFQGVQAKTLTEYLKELNAMLKDTQIQAGNVESDLDSVVVNVLKEGYAKQLDDINKKLDEQIKKENKRHNDFIENKQDELKTLEEQWNKDDYADKMKEFDEELLKVDTKLSRLRNDTSQYAAKLRKQLESDRAKIVDQQNKEIESKNRDDQKKAIQDEIEADTEKSDKLVDNLNTEKEAANEHWQTLIDNAEAYGKGLVDTYKNTHFDILKFLYGLVPEYSNVAKETAEAYNKGLKGQRSKVTSPVANIFGMSEQDYNQFISNGNKWNEASFSGKSTNTDELKGANSENNALRAKYGLPDSYYPTVSHDYNMPDDEYNKFLANGQWWTDHHKDSDWTSKDKQEEYKKRREENDELRKKYGMPAGSYPRFKGGGIMPYTGFAMLEENEMTLPERYTRLLDSMVDVNHSSLTNPNVSTVNNSSNITMGSAIKIENAIFQDPVDYDKLESIAGKKLQSDLNRKGIRTKR